MATRGASNHHNWRAPMSMSNPVTAHARLRTAPVPRRRHSADLSPPLVNPFLPRPLHPDRRNYHPAHPRSSRLCTP
ncbi:hypothetical protein NL676_022397 [Syzygium grande]|nr:hypothetical protein NL676_022397 [Syzygium grande]